MNYFIFWRLTKQNLLELPLVYLFLKWLIQGPATHVLHYQIAHPAILVLILLALNAILAAIAHIIIIQHNQHALDASLIAINA